MKKEINILEIKRVMRGILKRKKNNKIDYNIIEEDNILKVYINDYLVDKGYRCIGIDQRGFGSSDRPVCGYDYDTLSDDVKAVVDTLCLDNFVLLGHSTGGAIAIRYMARHNGKLLWSGFFN